MFDELNSLNMFWIIYSEVFFPETFLKPIFSSNPQMIFPVLHFMPMIKSVICLNKTHVTVDEMRKLIS